MTKMAELWRQPSSWYKPMVSILWVSPERDSRIVEEALVLIQTNGVNFVGQQQSLDTHPSCSTRSLCPSMPPSHNDDVITLAGCGCCWQCPAGDASWWWQMWGTQFFLQASKTMMYLWATSSQQQWHGCKGRIRRDCLWFFVSLYILFCIILFCFV